MKTKKVMACFLAFAMLGGGLTGCGDSNKSSDAQPNSGEKSSVDKQNGNYSDMITLVWYPNESAEDYEAAREEFGKLIEQATGKNVEQKLTTDYAIAIESLSSGSAQIGCVMGAEGYIQAKNANNAVNPLFVQSGESGTLDDALYYSFFAVKEENAVNYTNADGYSIDNIKGQKMSFVSNSSTSGFKVPTNTIISHFVSDNLLVDDLLEGGSDAFFS